MIDFVFPSDPINNKKVDPDFLEEATLLKNNFFNIHIIDIDNLEAQKKLAIENNAIYRGWMLNEEKYEKLNVLTGNKLITNTENYLKSHHLPNWYESLKEFTIESIICNTDNVLEYYQKSGWNKAFIKDYVKSLKTGNGSLVSSESDILNALENIRKYKGFIEGGIVLRKEENLKTETETRFFVLNGTLFSKTDNIKMIELAMKVKEKHNAFFYSLDIVEKENNELILVEVGDGQVSEAVNWNIEEFIKIFNSIKITHKSKKQFK